MKLKYVGPKPHHEIAFPIPLVSLANIQERITFSKGQVTEVKDELAEQCLEKMPEHFQKVESPTPVIAKKGT